MTENTAPLTWTSQKRWGSEGLTHHAETEIDGAKWVFTVDQPKKGQWVARAWRNGDFTMYREGTTLKGVKAEVQSYADQVAVAAAERSQMLVARIDLREVTEQQAAIATSAVEAAQAMRSMANAVALVQSARQRVQHRKDTCGCRTPLHTMRCGVNARPMVVSA